jgi:wyosine [tRNA(Phe)-imidazoG37] synthetase (radical SAM superfamily)/DNA-binding transcriptional ArsR family regulator
MHAKECRSVMPPETTPYRYLFGPVASRRLGRSLGVDLTPEASCTFDCLYCQCGATVHHTAERREWVPTANVIAELRRWHAAGGQADVVTLAGSGEPTLHTNFGEVLDAIREITGLPSVLLTNGSLLHLPEVRAAARCASAIKVTLSAADEAGWRALHRPAPGLRYEDAVAGLVALRREFAGPIWIEIMVLAGFNDSPGAIARIAERVRTVRPDRVQLNTAVRPPTVEDVARPVAPERLAELAQLFDPPAEVIGHATRHTEVGANGETTGAETDAMQATARAENSAHAAEAPSAEPAPARPDETGARLLDLVRRHPATAQEAAQALGLHPTVAERELGRLRAAGRVREVRRQDQVYYTTAEQADAEPANQVP